MRINYTMTEIIKTGGSYVILEIANRLARKGHKVTITTNFGQKIDGYDNIELLQPKGLIDKIGHITFRSPRILRNPRLPFRIARKALKLFYPKYLEPSRAIGHLTGVIPECDINVATDWLSAYPVFWSKKGFPFYHLQHHEVIFSNDERIKEMIKETYKLPLNKIANSIWLKGVMKEKYNIADLPVINPAINHNSFYPRKKGISKSKKRILCYGRHDEWKGFKDAIEAMKLVFKKRNDVEWLVYGFPGLPIDPEAPYTHVGFLSHDELAEIYSSSDLFFLASWYESFPLQPLEAMACGIPLVTTRYGTEDYAVDGENSLVVLPRDPEAMADAILKLLDDNDLRKKLIENALKTAKKFTWDKAVEKVEELFESAVKKPL